MATQPGVKLTRVGPASADLLAGSLMDAIAGTCQERPGAGDLIPMDFDDEIFDVEDDVADGADQPDFRATVLRSGAVRLVYWGSWLLSSGPAYTLIAARDRAGVAIADLRVVRDNDEMAKRGDRRVSQRRIRHAPGGAVRLGAGRRLRARLVRRRGRRPRADRPRPHGHALQRMRTAVRRRAQRPLLAPRPLLGRVPSRLLAVRLRPPAVDPGAAGDHLRDQPKRAYADPPRPRRHTHPSTLTAGDPTQRVLPLASRPVGRRARLHCGARGSHPCWPTADATSADHPRRSKVQLDRAPACPRSPFTRGLSSSE